MHEHKSWIEPLARAGYGARGVVYLVVGALAVLAPFGPEEETGTEGALRKIMEQPFGEWFIYALVVGLFGYVLWRLVQSLLDTDDHGWGAKGLAVRGGLLASAGTYTLLAIYALALTGLFGGGSGQGGDEQGPVASALAGVVGQEYVALVLSIVFLGVAGAHIWKAVTKGYEKHFIADEDKMKIIHPVAITGLIARGVVFVVIALLLFFRYMNERAASDDGGATPGLADALQFVQDLPAGPWLLAALGVGLLLFAGYSIAEAIWRRINVEEAQSPSEQAA